MKPITWTTQRALTLIALCLLWLTAGSAPVLAQERTSADAHGARYRIEFTATWSEDTHPHPDGQFPTASAHFSPLIGAVHGESASLWAAGELASAGIEQMAETGGTGLLRGEIAAAIDAGTALAVISGGGAPSPGSAVIESIEVSDEFPLVTLVTMIAPSPDWFVGVEGASLQDEFGQWVAERSFTLYPYDAGTDSGSDYVSPDADTDPAELIHSLRNQPPFSDAPIGTFTFTRIDEPTSRIFLPAVYRK